MTRLFVLRNESEPENVLCSNGGGYACWCFRFTVAQAHFGVLLAAAMACKPKQLICPLYRYGCCVGAPRLGVCAFGIRTSQPNTTAHSVGLCAGWRIEEMVRIAFVQQEDGDGRQYRHGATSNNVKMVETETT